LNEVVKFVNRFYFEKSWVLGRRRFNFDKIVDYWDYF